MPQLKSMLYAFVVGPGVPQEPRFDFGRPSSASVDVTRARRARLSLGCRL